MKSLLLVMLLLWAPGLWAAQDVWVKSNWAIVYADKQMQAPIGKIRQGKKIRAAEVARQYGTIIPIVVNNKIAYVYTKDLVMSFDEMNADGHKFSRQYDLYYEASDSFMDDLKENNRLIGSVGQMVPGKDWKDVSNAVGDSVENATVFRIAFEHRPPYYSVAWGAGLGVYTISQAHLKLLMPTVDFTYNYAPLKNDWLNIELSMKVLTSLEARIEASASDDGKHSAMWGYGGGAEAVLFPYRTLSFKGHAYYQSMNFVDSPGLAGVDMPVDQINGVEMGLSISYLF